MIGRDRYLLDTNIIIALFATDAGVIRQLQGAAEVFVPVIAVGELTYGAYRSTHRDDNLLRIDDFIQQSIILSCDLETAGHYGEIKDTLRKRGRPIPENDIWIAALAKQHQLILVSRDKHVAAVTGITVEAW